MLKPFLETGKIVGTHGVRGELRVQPWADSPKFLLRFSKLYLDAAGSRALDIISSRVHGNLVLIKVKGIDSIEVAETLRNKVLYMDRADSGIEDGSYFIQDLVGCAVFDSESGERLGEICDVSQTGANDVWHIRRGEQEYLIPVIDEVVQTVDPEAGKVTITPLKGIFDDED